jgi:DNA-binding response OmpR family regulator
VKYDFTKVKVLVVECSPAVFELLRDILSIFGVKPENTVAANTNEEAFDQFCRHNNDFVIIDWLRDPSHGIKLTHTIRNDKMTPNRFVPILMIAGSGHEKRVLRARDAGISEYLVKPFSAGALAERITRLIESPRQFVVAESFTGPDRRGTQQKEYTGVERRAGMEKLAVGRT